MIARFMKICAATSFSFPNQLQVNVDGDENWKDCFDVEGVELPTGYYFGLSAATGDLAGNWFYQYFMLYLILVFTLT